MPGLSKPAPALGTLRPRDLGKAWLGGDRAPAAARLLGGTESQERPGASPSSRSRFTAQLRSEGDGMASFDCRLLFSSLFVLSTANIILSNSSTVVSSVLSISQSHTQRRASGFHCPTLAF